MSKKCFENLSDAELHCELIQNGFPSMPVTETTRDILIKKLKNHTIKSYNGRQKKKRTLKNTLYPLNNKLELENKYLLDENHRHNADNINLLAGRSCSNTTFDRSGIYDLQFRQKVPPSSSFSKIYAPPPILASESEEDSDYLSYSSNTNKRRNVNCAIESCNFEKRTHNSNFSVVSRLLSLRDTTLRKSSCQTTYDTDETEVTHTRASNGRTICRKPITTKTILEKFISRFNMQTGFKQIVVPYALISTLVIFFIVLAFLYMFISHNLQNTISENSTHYTMCNEHDQIITGTPHTCIDGARLTGAIALNKELIQLLRERAERHYCIDNIQPSAVSVLEFVRYLYKKGIAEDVRKMIRNLQAAEYLIKCNPQWKINITTRDESRDFVDNGEKLIPNEETLFVLINPHLPMMCNLYKKMHQFFLIIGTGTLIGAVVLAIYLAFRFVKGWKYDRVIAVDHFTTGIINELVYRASLSEVSEEREVVIIHLRDKLIPLNKRSSLLWAWNEALRALESNDSRIHFSVSMRNGVEFRTMKWIGNVFLEERDRSCTKQWQSPAFDNTNKITNPPTPCLKIRHMFDSSEINHPKLKQIIEEAILEKVGSRCVIYDLQIDRQSCCVYVRCASEEDAGVLHNEINGWWFDKRLVYIKFLRLQRYISRFPQCSAKPISLLPVNTKNLLLTSDTTDRKLNIGNSSETSL